MSDAFWMAFFAAFISVLDLILTFINTRRIDKVAVAVDKNGHKGEEK